MALTVKQLVNRHGAFVSAVTGALVGAAILVMGLLQNLINSAWALGSGLSPSDLGLSVPEMAGRVLILAVPFAVGIFLSLWIIAPIAEELRLPHVITRAILATGVGATIYFVVLAVLGLIGAFAINGNPYSQLVVSLIGFDGAGAARAMGSAFATALSLFISTLPLGILAGVLLWLWRKDHPPRHPLSGLIDEV